MSRTHVDHKDIVRFAEDKVNLPIENPYSGDDGEGRDGAFTEGFGSGVAWMLYNMGNMAKAANDIVFPNTALVVIVDRPEKNEIN